MPVTWLILAIVLAYLVGSIPFGYLVARARGIDIFKEGSGNIGATNVGRVLGRKWGLFVFGLDFLKGALPTFATLQLAEPNTGVPPLTSATLAGLATLLGHMFPVYLRFKGGKGVATGAGVVTVLLPLPTMVAAITWIAVLFATRYVSLSSVAAAAALCLAEATLTGEPLGPALIVVTLFCWAAFALVVVRHRANLARLLRGTENRVRWSPTLLGASKILHVLSLGLWFGAGVFFIPATLSIFRAFEQVAEAPPTWLPVIPGLTREQATSLAGVAVNPLFEIFFPLQASCGLLALGTALGWTSLFSARRADRWRAAILTIAWATVLVGWPIARHVGTLRLERYSDDPAVADVARAAFGTWHGYSVALNLVTLVFVTLATTLAAFLPPGIEEAPMSPAAEKELPVAADREGEAPAEPREP